MIEIIAVIIALAAVAYCIVLQYLITGLHRRSKIIADTCAGLLEVVLNNQERVNELFMMKNDVGD